MLLLLFFNRVLSKINSRQREKHWESIENPKRMKETTHRSISQGGDTQHTLQHVVRSYVCVACVSRAYGHAFLFPLRKCHPRHVLSRPWTGSHVTEDSTMLLCELESDMCVTLAVVTSVLWAQVRRCWTLCIRAKRVFKNAAMLTSFGHACSDCLLFAGLCWRLETLRNMQCSGYSGFD